MNDLYGRWRSGSSGKPFWGPVAISSYWGFTIFVVQLIEKQLNLIQKAADLALPYNKKIWVRKDWNKNNALF